MANSIDLYLNNALQLGASDLILAEGLVPAVRVAGLVRTIPDASKLEFGDLEKFLGPLDGENGAFRGGPISNGVSAIHVKRLVKWRSFIRLEWRLQIWLRFLSRILL